MNISEINVAIDNFAENSKKWSIHAVRKKASELKRKIQENPDAKQINGVLLAKIDQIVTIAEEKYQKKQDAELIERVDATKVKDFSFKKSFRNKFSDKRFKLVAGVAGGLGFTALTIAAFTSKPISSKIVELPENIDFNQDDSNINHMDSGVLSILEMQDNTKEEAPVQENILPSYLSFDVNDNESMIEQSIAFILENRPCGVDFSSEDAIRKFMDFYLVVNLEEIDPMDYARLGYFNKTSQSIIDNYQFCMNQLREDMHTVTPDTMIPYDLIIADKDSAEVLMHIQSLVAQYNVAENTSEKRDLEKEIITFLEDNFMSEDGRFYTRATYEIVGRMVKSIDEIFHGLLPYDLTDVLSDDLYGCNDTVPTGDKNKSERAQAETSLREMLDDKLVYAMQYRDQDLFNVSDLELLTGNQVEWEIYSGVQDSILDYPFVENPAFSSYVGRGTSQQTVPSVTMETETGEVEVSVEEIESVGVDPNGKTPEQIQEEYEAAVVQQFGEQSFRDESHTITDPNGNVVASGINANGAEYTAGYQAGYTAGNNYWGKNPSSTSPSYLAGYELGYSEGEADRIALDNSNSSQSTTHFEPTENQTVDTQESVSEEGYKDVATPTPEPTPTPSVEESTTYVPVEESTSDEVIEEVITEDGYVEIETHFEPVASNSYLPYLRAMRAVLDPIMYSIPNDEMLLADSEMYDVCTKVKM